MSPPSRAAVSISASNAEMSDRPLYALCVVCYTRPRERNSLKCGDCQGAYTQLPKSERTQQK